MKYLIEEMTVKPQSSKYKYAYIAVSILALLLIILSTYLTNTDANSSANTSISFEDTDNYVNSFNISGLNRSTNWTMSYYISGTNDIEYFNGSIDNIRIYRKLLPKTDVIFVYDTNSNKWNHIAITNQNSDNITMTELYVNGKLVDNEVK